VTPILCCVVRVPLLLPRGGVPPAGAGTRISCPLYTVLERILKQEILEPPPWLSRDPIDRHSKAMILLEGSIDYCWPYLMADTLISPIYPHNIKESIARHLWPSPALLLKPPGHSWFSIDRHPH
jgi:hypothetical protein